MLVKTIYTAEEMKEEFASLDRDYYSYEGYEALINLFEECDCGQPTELDVIAICCDFNEEEPEDIADAYNIDITECEDKDEITETVLDYVNHHSWGQDLGNGYILYQAF